MKIIIFSNLSRDIYERSFDKKKLEDLSNSNDYINLIKSNLNNSRFDFNLLENKGFFVEEIYTNNKNYIKYLCSKNNLKSSNDFFTNIIHYLEFFKPNIVIYRDIDVLNINQIKEINYKLDFRIISVLLSGFPPRIKNYYKLFSHVIFRNPCMLNDLKHFCNSSSLIYHCFNSAILEKLKLKNFDQRNKILSFDGSSFSDGYYQHKKRYVYLNHLLKKKLVDCHIYENNNFYHYFTFFNYFLFKNFNFINRFLKKIYRILNFMTNFIFRKKFKRIQKILEELDNFKDEKQINFYGGPLKLLFHNSVKGPLFGIDYYKSINSSKNCLNIHTEGCGDCSGNIRLFEITGLGSCMISEKFKNMDQLFEDGKEYVSYSSLEELEEKINFLKLNPKHSEIIAKNGYNKTLSFHTDKVRSQEYSEILKKLIN